MKQSCYCLRLSNKMFMRRLYLSKIFICFYSINIFAVLSLSKSCKSWHPLDVFLTFFICLCILYLLILCFIFFDKALESYIREQLNFNFIETNQGFNVVNTILYIQTKDHRTFSDFSRVKTSIKFLVGSFFLTDPVVFKITNELLIVEPF